jgi:membrane fusion protein, heavy metal efflux system
MNYRFYLSVIIALFTTGFIACNNNKQSEDHAHAADGSHPGETGLQALSYTLYTNKSELFVEFKPLVVGQTSKFAAHLTKLSENFLPFTEGEVTVSLVVNEKGIKQVANAPSSPGIFRLALQPTQAGKGKLIFDIRTKEFTDQFIIDNISIYADEKTAIAAQPAETGGNEISFLKEQAWKIEFANTAVRKETIYDIVKATGEIIPSPGEQVTVAAKSNGIVKYVGNNNITGYAVRSGQTMFTITGGEIAFENVEAAKEAARTELVAAKQNYERNAELIKDRLVTKSEYDNAKLRYEQAQITVANLGRNYSGAKPLASPINGFIQTIFVSEGQYVSAGQPLAIITKNQHILLRADVSMKDASKLNQISEANFRIGSGSETYSTKTLNGKLISIAKTAAANTPFIPVHFQMDGKPELLPGTFAEVFLKTAPVADALVIPMTALIEEQGIFYAYVQTKGESFETGRQ